MALSSDSSSLPQERTIILDVASPSNTRARLTDMGFTTVEHVEATDHLLHWPGWHHARHERTLVIFPGRGAQMVEVFLRVLEREGDSARFTLAQQEATVTAS